MAGIHAGHIVTSADLKDGIGVIAAKINAETVTSSTTLQDDDELFFEVAANTTYIMDGWITYSGVADGGTSAGGLKMQFTGPSGSTLQWSNLGNNAGSGAPAGVSSLVQYNNVTEGLAAGSPRGVGTNGTSTPMSCAPRGLLIVGGTSGIFQFRWAQITSNATGTTVRAGSWLRLQKVV